MNAKYIFFYKNINLTPHSIDIVFLFFLQFISLLYGDYTYQLQNKLLSYNDFKHLGTPMSVYSYE